MTENDRIREYLLSLEKEPDPLCAEIMEYAAERDIPIIKQETAAFLATLVAAKRPGAILELGTAVGYSAIRMAMAYPGCRITTIEKDPDRIREARENFKKAGLEDRITLLEGDISRRIAEMEQGAFDMVFMDAAKGQYGKWLPGALAALACGGLLAADNVLQEGTVALSRFAVKRRERTIHGRMREFLREIKRAPGLQSAVVPVGDGVAVCVKLADHEH